MSVTVMRAIREHGPADIGSRMVLLMLAMRLQEAAPDGPVWPAVSTIAADCAMSERAVQRALKKLAASGWIEIERGGGRAQGGRHGVANRYRVQLNKLNLGPAKGDSLTPLGRRKPRQAGAERVTGWRAKGDRLTPDQEREQSREGKGDEFSKNEEVNGGVSAQALYWAKALERGGYIAPSAIGPNLAREMIAAGLVTESTLRERGISH